MNTRHLFSTLFLVASVGLVAGCAADSADVDDMADEDLDMEGDEVEDTSQALADRGYDKPCDFAYPGLKEFHNYYPLEPRKDGRILGSVTAQIASCKTAKKIGKLALNTPQRLDEQPYGFECKAPTQARNGAAKYVCTKTDSQGLKRTVRFLIAH